MDPADTCCGGRDRVGTLCREFGLDRCLGFGGTTGLVGDPGSESDRVIFLLGTGDWVSFAGDVRRRGMMVDMGPVLLVPAHDNSVSISDKMSRYSARSSGRLMAASSTFSFEDGS